MTENSEIELSFDKAGLDTHLMSLLRQATPVVLTSSVLDSSEWSASSLLFSAKFLGEWSVALTCLFGQWFAWGWTDLYDLDMLIGQARIKWQPLESAPPITRTWEGNVLQNKVRLCYQSRDEKFLLSRWA